MSWIAACFSCYQSRHPFWQLNVILSNCFQSFHTISTAHNRLYTYSPTKSTAGLSSACWFRNWNRCLIAVDYYLDQQGLEWRIIHFSSPVTTLLWNESFLNLVSSELQIVWHWYLFRHFVWNPFSLFGNLAVLMEIPFHWPLWGA